MRSPVNVDIAVRAAAAELFNFWSVPSPQGRWWGHRREWLLLPPAPVLVARADNDSNEDGCIIVKEMQEKTRRGRRASIIAPRQRNSGRSACLSGRDMAGNSSGAFGCLQLGRGPPRPPQPRPPIHPPLQPRPQPQPLWPKPPRLALLLGGAYYYVAGYLIILIT